MRIEEQYRLSMYQDLGSLDKKKNMRLKRHKISGAICVEKHIPLDMEKIYYFLKSHPSDFIPRIYECLPEGNELIVLEEYVEGRTLEDILQEEWFSSEEAAEIVLQICQALKLLHHAEPMIICRDLKAENVMMTLDGRVKIIDFDIARIFQKGKHRDTVLLGTMEYAAPEQYGYLQTDNRTDIFSVGVLLNYLVLKKFSVERTVRGPLEKVVRKCTSLDPEQRYQSVEELEIDIRKTYHNRYDKEVKNNFTIPGFRSRTPWKMALAICGYALLTYICFTMELTKEKIPLRGMALRFEQAMIWLWHFGFIAVCCDYRNCAKELSWIHSGNQLKRMAGYVTVYIVLCMLAVCMCIIGEMIFL